MTLILLLVAWLLTYLLHSTLLIGGAWLLERVGAVRSPLSRDTLWKVALVGGLLTASAQLALRLQPYAGHVALSSRADSPFIAVDAVRPADSVRATLTAASARTAAADAPALTAPTVPTAPTARRLLSGIHVSWPAMLLLLWLMGSLALLIRLVMVRSGLRRRLRARRPVEGGPLVATLSQLCAAARLRRPVRVTICPGLRGPIAFGTSEICLPARVCAFDPAGQRAVLAHELLHLVRRDPAWLLAAAVVESVLYVQPLNRLARRRFQEVAEYLCDDWAADRTDGGVALARCLAEVASWIQAGPQLTPVSGMAENRSQLVARVQRLLDGARGGGGSARWAVRMAAGVLALAAVGWTAPGVAADNLDEEAPAETEITLADGRGTAWKAEYAAAVNGDGWASLRDGGRLIVLHAGYSARLSGRGRIGFRQWGRALVVPDGYTVMVGGEAVSADRDLCEEEQLRIVDAAGRTAWVIEPVALRGAPAYAARTEHVDRVVADAMQHSRVRHDSLGVPVDANEEGVADVTVEDGADVTVDEAELEAKVDGAIDTLLRAWARDPQAVRSAARRIARTYERELRPQFESLGIEVGRQLTPQLERLTTRVGRDLAPEFARLGAELGRTIVAALSDANAEFDDGGAGAGDFRAKRRPKSR